MGSSSRAEKVTLGQRWSIGRLLAGLLLVIYLIAICYFGLRALWPQIPRTSLWAIQNTDELVRWFGAVSQTLLIYAVAGIPLGLLVACFIGWRRRSFPQGQTRNGPRFVPHLESATHLLCRVIKRSFVTRVCRGVLAFVALFVASLVISCPTAGAIIWVFIRDDFLGSIVVILASCLGCVLGVWIGLFLNMGRRGLIAIAFQCFLFVAVLLCGGIWLSLKGTADEPLRFQPPTVTSAAKRKVVDHLKEARKAAQDEQHVVVNEDDVNFLLAWGLSLGSPDRKVKIEFGEDESNVQASIGLPFGNTTRYLNVDASGQLSVNSGQISVNIRTFEVGELTFSPAIVRPIVGIVTFLLKQDADFQAALNRVELLQGQANGVEFAEQSPSSDTDNELVSGQQLVASLLAKLGEKPEVSSTVRTYVTHLLKRAPDMPADGNDRFKAFVIEAFQLARKRSRSRDSDPVLENRAAVLALGILLGHPKVETFVGSTTDESMRSRARKTVGKVCIHNRIDWPRHFMVSAALAVLSADFVSDAAGLLKEELDADGGSGFSFGDLAADRAGTLFALAATKNAESARALQDELANQFEIDDLLPLASDLPEDLTDRELQAKYGGVGGERYLNLVQEIERRLTKCKLLR